MNNPEQFKECIITYESGEERIALPCFIDNKFDGWMVCSGIIQPPQNTKIVSWKYLDIKDEDRDD